MFHLRLKSGSFIGLEIKQDYVNLSLLGRGNKRVQTRVDRAELTLIAKAFVVIKNALEKVASKPVKVLEFTTTQNSGKVQLFIPHDPMYQGQSAVLWVSNEGGTSSAVFLNSVELERIADWADEAAENMRLKAEELDIKMVGEVT